MTVSVLGADATGPVLVIEGLSGNVTGQKRAQGQRQFGRDLLPGLLENRDKVFCNMGRYPDFDKRLMGWVNDVRAKSRNGVHGPGEFVDLDHIVHEMRLFKRADEILLDVHILVKELAKQFLIDIIADSHQRELEEAGHRWRQGIDGFTVLLEINEDGPVGQLIKDVLRFGEILLPDTAGLVRGKWFDRHQ